MKGSIICVVGVLVLSFDTVLLRLIGHLPVMTVLFVKFALVAGTFLSIHVMDSREKCVEKFLNIGRLGFACGIVWGISNVFFTMAILTTYVANVLIIMACNSVFAAVFGYVVFGITQSLRTTVTCIVSIGAILLVCLTSILEKSDDDEVSGNVVLGNIYAIVASLTMGLYFVLLEQVSTLNPQL
jgi:drug/metabolite transporter (DMT)-like permease